MRQQIFEHVRAHGRASRADMTRALDISAGSATTVTAELIAEGYLREVDGRPRDTGRGRPPVDLEVIPEKHFVIGIKISDTQHTALLSDFAGNVLAEYRQDATPVRRAAATMLDETATLVSGLLDNSGIGLANITAIGIGITGIVDAQTGHVVWSPLLVEEDIDFAALCAARFDTPVILDNDVNVLTLAELWFGLGRKMADFAVVTIENGVGMGLVLNNRLFRGSRGMGLELGHTKVQLDGALCRCGQRGCLEAYLADYALAREAATTLGPLPGDSPSMGLDALLARAESGDQAAQTIFRRAGRYLSVGLANVVQLFDPALIILGGNRVKYDFLHSDEVMTEMQALTLSEGRSPVPVVTHTGGDFGWARGATALALDMLTHRDLGAGRATSAV